MIQDNKKVKDFAIQRCCPTSIFLKQYESSTDAILEKLGISVVDIEEFNCCGYPLKNINYKAHVLSSARNLSLAEKRSMDILTFCNCCYVTLRQVSHLLRDDEPLRKDINTSLEKEGLGYQGGVEIKHLLDILYKDVSIERIREKIIKSFNGLKIAIHYGCHILRPKEHAQFDDPGTSLIFDQLVEMTGAESVSWQTQPDCCGSPVWGVNDDLSMDLIQKKITDARESGADYLCVACPFCQTQFDRAQKMLQDRRGMNHSIPSILYTQLLGLSLGIDKKSLGIDQNELSINKILEYLD